MIGHYDAYSLLQKAVGVAEAQAAIVIDGYPIDGWGVTTAVLEAIDDSDSAQGSRQLREAEVR